MKIFTISDLHLEFRAHKQKDILRLFNFTFPKADVLILAGDIGYPRHNILKRFLEKMKELYKEVIYVPGNHEYYGYTYKKELTEYELRKLCESLGVHFLLNNKVDIGGVRFIGTTLWTNTTTKAFALMNDSRYVFRTTQENKDEHFKCLSFLKGELKQELNGKDDEKNQKHDEINQKIVVITHHPPSSLLRHERFVDRDDVFAGYYNDIIDDLNLENVKLWFSGHTHEFTDVMISSTRFVINPLGYMGEKRQTRISLNVYEL
jgi:predicted MPP superfamily phosphohydrolase